MKHLIFGKMNINSYLMSLKINNQNYKYLRKNIVLKNMINIFNMKKIKNNKFKLKMMIK